MKKKSSSRDDIHNNSRLQIKSYTWERDSHGLFDFECNNIIENQFIINLNSRIIRIGDQVMLETNQLQNDAAKILLEITANEGNYQLQLPHSEADELSNKIWKLIRPFKLNRFVV